MASSFSSVAPNSSGCDVDPTSGIGETTRSPVIAMRSSGSHTTRSADVCARPRKSTSILRLPRVRVSDVSTSFVGITTCMVGASAKYRFADAMSLR